MGSLIEFITFQNFERTTRTWEERKELFEKKGGKSHEFYKISYLHS